MGTRCSLADGNVVTQRKTKKRGQSLSERQYFYPGRCPVKSHEISLSLLPLLFHITPAPILPLLFSSWDRTDIIFRDSTFPLPRDHPFLPFSTSRARSNFFFLSLFFLSPDHPSATPFRLVKAKGSRKSLDSRIIVFSFHPLYLSSLFVCSFVLRSCYTSLSLSLSLFIFFLISIHSFLPSFLPSILHLCSFATTRRWKRSDDARLCESIISFW